MVSGGKVGWEVCLWKKLFSCYVDALSPPKRSIMVQISLYSQPKLSYAGWEKQMKVGFFKSLFRASATSSSETSHFFLASGKVNLYILNMKSLTSREK